MTFPVSLDPSHADHAQASLLLPKLAEENPQEAADSQYGDGVARKSHQPKANP